MHPRGIYELRNLGKQEIISVEGEDFAVCRNCRKGSNNNYMTATTSTNGRHI
jgi:hypothetical protein